MSLLDHIEIGVKKSVKISYYVSFIVSHLYIFNKSLKKLIFGIHINSTLQSEKHTTHIIFRSFSLKMMFLALYFIF